MTILNLAEFMEHWGRGELDIEKQVRVCVCVFVCFCASSLCLSV